MPASRINMRKIKDVLRLNFQGKQPHQNIATALGISKGVVTKYISLAMAAKLDWTTIEAMDEAELERRLLACERAHETYVQPDYARIGHQRKVAQSYATTASALLDCTEFFPPN